MSGECERTEKKAADMVLETLGKKYPCKTIEDVNFHINVYVRILYHLIDKIIEKEHRTMDWKESNTIREERKKKRCIRIADICFEVMQ